MTNLSAKRNVPEYGPETCGSRWRALFHLAGEGAFRFRNELFSAVWGGRFLLAFGLVLAATVAFGQSNKLSKDLQNLPSSTSVGIVVQYYTAPNKTDYNAASANSALKRKDLTRIKATQYNIPAGKLSGLLSSDANIKYISKDRPLNGSMDYAAATVGADLAWSLGLNGSGIGVAVVDSGVTLTNDLKNPATGKSRIVYSQSFVDGDTSTNDAYEHGTHVSGIIAGNGSNSECSNCTVAFQGIAPAVNIVNLRALDAYGQGTDSAVIAAIQQAIALKSTYNIRVLNLSLGRGIFESYTTDPLCLAVEDAWKAGLVVVVAAGNYGRDNSNNNDGYGTITAPANDPYVISVGAMKTMYTKDRADDLIATYSSKGPSLLDHVVKPDLVAPGNRVISLLSSASTTATSYPDNVVAVSYYTSNNNNNSSSSYYRLSGTSMAAPMVSGTVALLLQQNPLMTPDQVKARLMKTAYKTFPTSSTYVDPDTGISYVSQYDIFTVGAGYMDIMAALSSPDLAPSTVGVAKSPIAGYDATTGNVYLLSDSSVIWGNSVMWGNSVVWGNSVIWGNLTTGQSVIWGNSVVWGNSTTAGFSVIWGNSVVWGNQTSSEAMRVSIKGDK
jgi:serine protease AprX